MILMTGMMSWVRFRASPACEVGFETRPYVASLSLRDGVLCITTVIPAKAGIQRGRATGMRT